MTRYKPPPCVKKLVSLSGHVVEGVCLAIQRLGGALHTWHQGGCIYSYGIAPDAHYELMYFIVRLIRSRGTDIPILM